LRQRAAMLTPLLTPMLTDVDEGSRLLTARGEGYPAQPRDY
jgi:hypothetical protein